MVLRGLLLHAVRGRWGVRQYAMQCPIEPPTDCCGAGCSPCVWDNYYDEVEEWEKEHEKELADIEETPSSCASAHHAPDLFSPPEKCVSIRYLDSPATFLTESEHLRHVGVKEALVTHIASGAKHRHITLDMQCDVEPGGHVLVYAPNDPSLVARLLERLNLDGDRVMEITPSVFSAGEASPNFPRWVPVRTPMRVADLFRYYLDVTSLRCVRQPLLHVMADAATDKEEEHRLRHLASLLGVHDFRLEVKAHNPDLLSFLHDFPSSTPPLARLLGALPHLFSRVYSTAADSGEALALFAGQTCYRRKGVVVHGHTTGYLHSISVGDKVWIGGPEPPHKPLRLFELDVGRRMIWVAMGSGIAPFRSFWRRMAKTGMKDQALLYVGCREREDLVYLYELAEMCHDRTLATAHLALSTLPHDSTGRSVSRLGYGADKYVWGLLWCHGETISKWIREGAAVYVCGTHKMVMDTERAVRCLLEDYNSPVSFQQLQREGRWRVEGWSNDV